MELRRREKFGKRRTSYLLAGMPTGRKVEWDTTQFFAIAKANIEPPRVVILQTFPRFEQWDGEESACQACLNYFRQWLM